MRHASVASYVLVLGTVLLLLVAGLRPAQAAPARLGAARPVAESGVAGPVQFAGVVPVRAADTRSGSGVRPGALGAGQVLAVPVAGRLGVPGDAGAVVLNVTVTRPAGAGYATVFPCGRPRPVASNLNFVPGQTEPNAVVAQVGESGRVCVFASAAAHLVVDVNGYFPSTGASDPPTTDGRIGIYDGVLVRRDGNTLTMAWLEQFHRPCFFGSGGPDTYQGEYGDLERGPASMTIRESAGSLAVAGERSHNGPLVRTYGPGDWSEMVRRWPSLASDTPEQLLDSCRAWLSRR